MNMKHLLLAGAVIGLSFSATSIAEGLTDQFDPYVTSDEISPTVEMRTPSQERLVDIYDPFILSEELIVKESCPDPANTEIAEFHDPYVTIGEIREAMRNSKC